MTTAQEYIECFKELAPDQKQIVIDYVVSVIDDEVQDEFSEEDIAIVLQAKKEADQGINISGPFVGEEANDHLRNLMRNE